MASKAKQQPKEEAPEKEAEGAADSPLPLLDLSDAGVKKMIKAAKKRGFVTYEQLNAVMPSEEVTSEQIEDTLAMLSEMGINVVETEDANEDDGEEKATDEVAAADDDDEDTGTEVVEAKTKSLATTEKKEPSERTDDPVRMYLREMGSVELLSREGEIAIAKRIEAGREAMIAGLCEMPAHLPGHHHLARRVERRKSLPPRHHRSGSDLCRPRRQGDAAAGDRPRRQTHCAGAGRYSRSGRAAFAGRAVAGGAAGSAARRHPVQGRGCAGRTGCAGRRRRRRGAEGSGRCRRRERLRRRRHGEFAVARRDRGRAQAEGGRDLRQHRRQLQAPAPPAGAGHRIPPEILLAVAGAGAQIQEAEGRDHLRGEVAAAQPGAHRFAWSSSSTTSTSGSSPTKAA